MASTDVVVASAGLHLDGMKPIPSEPMCTGWAKRLVETFGYIWYRHRTIIAAPGEAYEISCPYSTSWTTRYETYVRYMDIWKVVKLSYYVTMVTGTFQVRLRVTLNGTDYTDEDSHSSSESGALTVNVNHAPADNPQEKCYVIIETKNSAVSYPGVLSQIVIHANSE